MAVLTPIQDGMAGDPDLVMAWIKNGNYGTALPPMAQDGANTDNTLDLGTTTARWRKVNAGGVVAGTTVGSFTVPERRFARFTLPAKNVASYVPGYQTYFTIDASSLGRITATSFMLTFVGDDFNFSTGTGTIINSAENMTSYSLNTGYSEYVYQTFTINMTNSTITIGAHAFYNGIWDYYSNYFVDNTSNWDGTAQSRGWLDIEYTPI